MERYSPGNNLLDLVRRHPFLSEHCQADLCDPPSIRDRLCAGESGLRRVEVAGLGRCLADRREPNASLLGIHRIAVARSYALAVMGRQAFRLGMSPGMEADGEFFWQDHWWRVWVDVGACAPEALRFVDQPPASFRGGVRDVVIVQDDGRLEPLIRLIERSWPTCSREVILALMPVSRGPGEFDVPEYRSVQPRHHRKAATWSMPVNSEVSSHLRERQRGSRHRSLLGELARHVDYEGWRLLMEFGSNPLVTARELSVLRTPMRGQQAAVLEHIRELEQLDLIETPASPDPWVALDGRKVLTWRGVELLAEHAGTNLEILRRRQPWPLRADPRKKGKTVYSLRWVRTQQHHQALTRSFTLALVEGSRRVSRPTGGVDVEVQTTIGGRLMYEERGGTKGDSIRHVSPDAVCSAEFWRAAWLEGIVGPRRTLARHTLFIEVDRSTMGIDRVAERIERYAEVWRAMAELRPALVWVIEGTPFREAQILDRMAQRGLEGWTVTLERLVLDGDHAWWMINSLAHLNGSGVRSGLEPPEFGGMCPWRPIWRAPGEIRFVPLLSREPWRDAATHGGPTRPSTDATSSKTRVKTEFYTTLPEQSPRPVWAEG